jgi:lipoate-protein ligase B
MAIQDQAYELVKSSGFPVVLGFEYYPVITLGKRASVSEEILSGLPELERQGFEIAETDRGGQATLHSPGQLVIYPLVDIKKLGISVRQYVSLLEQTTILWLEKYKLIAQAAEDAGVFTEHGKIAFIGLRVDRGITRHGISINISNDLSLFRTIRACGLASRSLDSLFSRGVEIELKAAFEEWNLYWASCLLQAIPDPAK